MATAYAVSIKALAELALATELDKCILLKTPFLVKKFFKPRKGG